MSEMAIYRLKKIGAKAIVSHCHVQSPNNSSYKYLKKLGFNDIKFLPDYWKNVDYFCSTCHKNPCECSAIEMILHI